MDGSARTDQHPASRAFATRSGPHETRRLFRRGERNRLAPLRRLDDLHRDLLSVSQGTHARLLHHRDVDEDVLAAILGHSEAEALVGIEPLHCSRKRGCCARIGPHAIVRPFRSRPPAWCRRGAARIHLENGSDLATLLPLGHLNLQFGLRCDGLVPRVLQDPNMQESVARTVGELHEAETLFRVEPFDRRVQRWTGRRRIMPRRPAEWRLIGNLIAWVWPAECVVVKPAPALAPVSSLLSHVLARPTRTPEGAIRGSPPGMLRVPAPRRG